MCLEITNKDVHRIKMRTVKPGGGSSWSDWAVDWGCRITRFESLESSGCWESEGGHCRGTRSWAENSSFSDFKIDWCEGKILASSLSMIRAHASSRSGWWGDTYIQTDMLRALLIAVVVVVGEKAQVPCRCWAVRNTHTHTHAHAHTAAV